MQRFARCERPLVDGAAELSVGRHEHRDREHPGDEHASFEQHLTHPFATRPTRPHPLGLRLGSPPEDLAHLAATKLARDLTDQRIPRGPLGHPIARGNLGRQLFAPIRRQNTAVDADGSTAKRLVVAGRFDVVDRRCLVPDIRADSGGGFRALVIRAGAFAHAPRRPCPLHLAPAPRPRRDRWGRVGGCVIAVGAIVPTISVNARNRVLYRLSGVQRIAPVGHCPFLRHGCVEGGAERARTHGDVLVLAAGQPSTPAPAPVLRATQSRHRSRIARLHRDIRHSAAARGHRGPSQRRPRLRRAPGRGRGDHRVVRARSR